MSNVYRDRIIEEVAVMLAASYPDNVNTNAFCAAVRSLKGPIKTPRRDADGACTLCGFEI